MPESSYGNPAVLVYRCLGRAKAEACPLSIDSFHRELLGHAGALPALMREMIGRTLPDLAVRIEPQIFADLRAAFVLVNHDDAVWADIGVDQIEMQVGQELERLAPVDPQIGLAAQRAAGL